MSSCSGKSRHINIRYFFIKDLVKREMITTQHCPTEIMIADFFTKALQGNQFRRLRDVIMGIMHPSELKEHVENHESRKVSMDKCTKHDPETRLSQDLQRREEKEKSYADVVKGNLN